MHSSILTRMRNVICFKFNIIFFPGDGLKLGKVFGFISHASGQMQGKGRDLQSFIKGKNSFKPVQGGCCKRQPATELVQMLSPRAAC